MTSVQSCLQESESAGFGGCEEDPVRGGIGGDAIFCNVIIEFGDHKLRVVTRPQCGYCHRHFCG